MKIFVHALCALFLALALIGCGGFDESESGDHDQHLAETESMVVYYGDWVAGDRCRFGSPALTCPPSSPDPHSDCNACAGPFKGPGGCFMDCGGLIIPGTIITPSRTSSR